MIETVPRESLGLPAWDDSRQGVVVGAPFARLGTGLQEAGAAVYCEVLAGGASHGGARGQQSDGPSDGTCAGWQVLTHPEPEVSAAFGAAAGALHDGAHLAISAPGTSTRGLQGEVLLFRRQLVSSARGAGLRVRWALVQRVRLARAAIPIVGIEAGGGVAQ